MKVVKLLSWQANTTLLAHELHSERWGSTPGACRSDIRCIFVSQDTLRKLCWTLFLVGDNHRATPSDLESQAEHKTTGGYTSPQVPQSPLTVCGLFQAVCIKGRNADQELQQEAARQGQISHLQIFLKWEKIMAKVISDLDLLCSCSTLWPPCSTVAHSRLPEPLQGKGQLCCPSQCWGWQHTG